MPPRWRVPTTTKTWRMQTHTDAEAVAELQQ
jgi:hypothetical protein